MRCTPERAFELLGRWRDDGAWVFAVARFSEGDEHRFWARIQNSAAGEIWLAGENSMVSLRLDAEACQFSEFDSLPLDVADQMNGFRQCLTITCNEFSAAMAVRQDLDRELKYGSSQQKVTPSDSPVAHPDTPNRRKQL